MDIPCNSMLVFFVNGKKVVEENPDPEEILVNHLRNKCGLRGTKVACGVGSCGSCTVMLSTFSHANKRVSHNAVNACLVPLVSLHGVAVTTIEGVGNSQTKLHNIQKQLAESHGTQCGFCSPGMVMSMYTLLRNNPNPSQDLMEKSLAGNLCRCTGYRPILKGFQNAAKSSSFCPMGDKCCKNQPPQSEVNSDREELCDYEPTQESIFPPELMVNMYSAESKCYEGAKVKWYRPADLESLLKHKHENPEARLIGGNVTAGVGNSSAHPITYISLSHLETLQAINPTENGLEVGSAVTITNLMRALQGEIDRLPEEETRSYKHFIDIFQHYGSEQIRNVSTVGGNLIDNATAGHYVSDLTPLLLASGARMRIMSLSNGIIQSREVVISENIFRGSSALSTDEILHSIIIPKLSQPEYFVAHKHALRREFDLAVVNSAVKVKFVANSDVIAEIALFFGGVTGPKPILLAQTGDKLLGRHWDDDTMSLSLSMLEEELTARNDVIDEYKKSLVIGLFYKSFVNIRQQLITGGLTDGVVSAGEMSAVSPLYNSSSKAVQVYQLSEEEGQGDCWKPILHKSAELHATGEARYVEDITPFKEEVFVGLVTSTLAHAKILSIDASEALSSPGVRDFFCHKDIPGQNRFFIEEQLMATDEVTCVGHLIGAVVADTQKKANEAAKMVKIEYEELPAVLNIKEAIAANSYLQAEPVQLWKGDVEEGFSKSDFTLTGELSTGGQCHFYLETQCAVCVPTENDEMEVHVAAQGSGLIHQDVSAALNVPMNKINVRIKRAGGAFGGKETKPSIVAVPTALAAHRLKRPARCQLTRKQDMEIIGGRHPFYAKYKVGFDKDGQIQALKCTLYSNGGNSMDTSVLVMQKAVMTFENGYTIPNIHLEGYVCKTNTTSNTAYRGFGSTQAMLIMENILDSVAAKLGMPVIQVREKHLNRDGDTVIYRQVLTDCSLRKCWQQVINSSDYHKRALDVDCFNSENRWKKRGICLLPTKYGIAYHVDFLNQSACLVQIYTDGNVLICTGGNEMGQGIFTKMIQIASQTLGISSDKIHIVENSTNTVPNTVATSGSTGTDLNGMATLNACLELNNRLEPVKKANPQGQWEDWILKAYLSRISLSATGFYKMRDDLYLNWETSEGHPFPYFTYGAAVSEVEIDCLTGAHQILRTDIVMDVGKSLNPAIDVGQIEGGFMQGYGYYCLEEVKRDGRGHILSNGPETYRIPTMGTIPREFNVSLLKDAPNVHAVYSSKGIGEPPLFLAASVFFAIKAAIRAARKDADVNEELRLDPPATAEKIRFACSDQLLTSAKK